MLANPTNNALNTVDSTMRGGYQQALRCVDAENCISDAKRGVRQVAGPLSVCAEVQLSTSIAFGVHPVGETRHVYGDSGFWECCRARCALSGKTKRRHQVRRRGVSACASKSTPDASQNRSARRLLDFTDQFARRLANPADHRIRRCSDPTVQFTRRCPDPADQPTRRPADPFGPSHPEVFRAGNLSARRPPDPRAPLGPKTVCCASRHSE